MLRIMVILDVYGLCFLMFMICAIFHFKDLRHICSLGFVPRPSPPPAPPAPLSPPPPQPPPRWSWWWRWWWCWPPPIRITAKKQDFKTYLMKMLRILSYFTRLRAPPFSPSTSMSPNHLLGLPGEPHLESPPPYDDDGDDGDGYNDVDDGDEPPLMPPRWTSYSHCLILSCVLTPPLPHMLWMLVSTVKVTFHVC